MKSNTLKITQTGLLLALLITLQWATKPLGQMITGSCVNAVLAACALLCGPGCGIFVALVSPVVAFLLGIAPQLVTVPAIMVGNAVLVIVLHFLGSTAPVWKKAVSILAASAAKFAVLYVLVVKVICGALSAGLLEQGLLKAPMLQALPTMFAWPQLFTALIGCTLASVIVPFVRKALKM